MTDLSNGGETNQNSPPTSVGLLGFRCADAPMTGAPDAPVFARWGGGDPIADTIQNGGNQLVDVVNRAHGGVLTFSPVPDEFALPPAPA